MKNRRLLRCINTLTFPSVFSRLFLSLPVHSLAEQRWSTTRSTPTLFASTSWTTSSRRSRTSALTCECHNFDSSGFGVASPVLWPSPPHTFYGALQDSELMYRINLRNDARWLSRNVAAYQRRNSYILHHQSEFDLTLLNWTPFFFLVTIDVTVFH